MKHYLKIFICVVIAVLLSSAIVIGLGAFLILRPVPLDEPSKQFEAQLAETKQKPGPVYFSDLISFDWEKVCFVSPYMLDENIKELIGSDYTLGHIDTNDDGNYNILFGLPDKRTQAIRVPRVFYQLNARPCMTYQDSKTVPLYF